MKCESCQQEVSPKFVAAIRNNSCPACGGQLLSEADHKRIFKVKSQLTGTGLDDNTMFSVAAALSEKFTLVPRDLLLTDKKMQESSEKKEERRTVPAQPASAPSKASVKKTNPSSHAYIDPLDSDDFAMSDDDVSSDDFSDDDNYTEDYDEIIKEWGLDVNARDKTGEKLPGEVLQGIEQIGKELVNDVIDIDNSPERQALLARAAALKQKNSDKIIRRVG